MTETVTGKKRDLPLWLGILLIVLGLTGATWFVWSQVSGFWAAPKGVFKIPGVEPGLVNGNPGRPMRPPSAIREISKTEWRIRSTPFAITIRKGTDDKLAVTMLASTMRILPPDAQWVLISKTRLDAAAAEKIGLNANQVRKFKTLPTAMTNPVNLAPAQLDSIRAAFQKYIDATGPQRDQADREVIAAIAAAGKEALPELTSRLQGQYDAFKASITPDQWTQLKNLTTAPVEAPASSQPAQ